MRCCPRLAASRGRADTLCRTLLKINPRAGVCAKHTLVSSMLSLTSVFPCSAACRSWKLSHCQKTRACGGAPESGQPGRKIDPRGATLRGPLRRTKGRISIPTEGKDAEREAREGPPRRTAERAPEVM